MSLWTRFCLLVENLRARRLRFALLGMVATLAIAATALVALAAPGARTAPPAGPSGSALAVAVVDSCGYPNGTGRPATVFNESAVLRDSSQQGQGFGTQVIAWYSDEHALTLGSGASVTQMATHPTDHASSPNVGDLTATDPAGRPLYPALFITDITANPNDRSGDWQQQSDNSKAITPDDLFGTWKTSNAADPASNSSFGTGADTPPAGISYEGFRTEVRWNIGLNSQVQPGHTYRVQFMVHDGDQNQSGGDVGEACKNFTVSKAGPTVKTTAQTPVTVGGNGTALVHDTATLSGGTNHAGGTLTFRLYSDASCTTKIGEVGTTTAVDGADGKTYTSNNVTAPGGGTYYWSVQYSGDSGNDPIAETKCGLMTGENIEQVVVNPLSPTINTNADTDVPLGTNGTAVLHDTATLSGGTSNAGGTITFHLYADNGAGGCGSEVAGSPVTSPVNGANGVDYVSPGIAVHAAGDYHWRVSYLGDNSNSNIALTACGQAADNELSHVTPAAPSITTTLSVGNGGHVPAGGTVHDSATLSGATSNAGGHVTYTVYTDANCSQGAQSAGTVTVTNGHVPDSNGIAFNNPGTFYWQASYTGDTNNDPAVSNCSEEQLTVTGLAIEKHADNNQVEVGSQVGFSVTVTGSGPAQGVTLNDPLPSGPLGNRLNWSISSVTGKLSIAACHITGAVGSQLLTCDPIDLGTGSHGQVAESYTVHVVSPTNPNGPGFTIKNIATASATNDGSVTDDDTAAGDTNPLGPGTGNTIIVSALAIEKHADDNSVNVGDTIGYSTTVTGSGPAKDVVLNDPLPAGPANGGIVWKLDSVSGKLTLSSCHISGAVGSQVLSCDPVDLGGGPDGSVPQSYTVHVSSPTNPNGPPFTIKNIATATSSNHSPVKDDDTAVGDTNPTAPGTGNTIEVNAQAVLGERITPGTANLLAPTGCVAKAFNARVRGSKIASVVFRLDGKVIKRVTNRSNATLIQTRINPAKLSIGVHRLVVTVTFTKSSGTKTKTIRVSFQRCSKKLAPPRFTG